VMALIGSDAIVMKRLRLNVVEIEVGSRKAATLEGFTQSYKGTNQTCQRTIVFEYNNQLKPNHKVFCSENSMHL